MTEQAQATILVPTPSAEIVEHIEDCIKKTEEEYGEHPLDDVARAWIALVREALSRGR